MKPLRLLVVDDEPLARRRVRDLVVARSDVQVAGECALGREAVEALRRGGHDVVFLDVRMPDMDGFEVLEEVGLDALPIVVFVTAHGDHALQAFDVHAVDYLLKPFEDERFYRALERARLAVQGTESDRLRERLRELIAGERAPRTEGAVVVRSGGRTTLVAPAEIRFVEADGSYVRLHTREHVYLLRESLGRMEESLEGRGFQRIHRSSIVCLAEVRELRNDAGGHRVVLKDGTALRVSDRYWRKLQNELGA